MGTLFLLLNLVGAVLTQFLLEWVYDEELEPKRKTRERTWGRRAMG